MPITGLSQKEFDFLIKKFSSISVVDRGSSAALENKMLLDSAINYYKTKNFRRGFFGRGPSVYTAFSGRLGSNASKESLLKLLQSLKNYYEKEASLELLLSECIIDDTMQELEEILRSDQLRRFAGLHLSLLGDHNVDIPKFRCKVFSSMSSLQKFAVFKSSIVSILDKDSMARDTPRLYKEFSAEQRIDILTSESSKVSDNVKLTLFDSFTFNINFSAEQKVYILTSESSKVSDNVKLTLFDSDTFKRNFSAEQKFDILTSESSKVSDYVKIKLFDSFTFNINLSAKQKIDILTSESSKVSDYVKLRLFDSDTFKRNFSAEQQIDILTSESSKVSDHVKLRLFDSKLFYGFNFEQQAEILKQEFLTNETKEDLLYPGGSCNKIISITGGFKFLKEASVKPVTDTLYADYGVSSSSGKPEYGDSYTARGQFNYLLNLIKELNEDVRFKSKIDSIIDKVSNSRISDRDYNQLMRESKIKLESLYVYNKETFRLRAPELVNDLIFDHCLAGCMSNIDMLYNRVAYGSDTGLRSFLSTKKREIYRDIAASYLKLKQEEAHHYWVTKGRIRMLLRGTLLHSVGNGFGTYIGNEVHEVKSLLNILDNSVLAYDRDTYGTVWNMENADHRRLKINFKEYVSLNIEEYLVDFILMKLGVNYDISFGAIDTEIKKVFAEPGNESSLDSWIHYLQILHSDYQDKDDPSFDNSAARNEFDQTLRVMVKARLQSEGYLKNAVFYPLGIDEDGKADDSVVICGDVILVRTKDEYYRDAFSRELPDDVILPAIQRLLSCSMSFEEGPLAENASHYLKIIVEKANNLSNEVINHVFESNDEAIKRIVLRRSSPEEIRAFFNDSSAQNQHLIFDYVPSSEKIRMFELIADECNKIALIKKLCQEKKLTAGGSLYKRLLGNIDSLDQAAKNNLTDAIKVLLSLGYNSFNDADITAMESALEYHYSLEIMHDLDVRKSCSGLRVRGSKLSLPQDIINAARNGLADKSFTAVFEEFKEQRRLDEQARAAQVLIRQQDLPEPKDPQDLVNIAIVERDRIIEGDMVTSSKLAGVRLRPSCGGISVSDKQALSEIFNSLVHIKNAHNSAGITIATAKLFDNINSIVRTDLKLKVALLLRCRSTFSRSGGVPIDALNQGSVDSFVSGKVCFYSRMNRTFMSSNKGLSATAFKLAERYEGLNADDDKSKLAEALSTM